MNPMIPLPRGATLALDILWRPKIWWNVRVKRWRLSRSGAVILGPLQIGWCIFHRLGCNCAGCEQQRGLVRAFFDLGDALREEEAVEQEIAE